VLKISLPIQEAWNLQLNAQDQTVVYQREGINGTTQLNQTAVLTKWVLWRVTSSIHLEIMMKKVSYAFLA
jgi:hypothetical protein